ncbi:unnamed protein product [Somion occarium]|uniref:Uncharacterized protein n=1 Tax=Somion occarium TaxID=3059160 RepID=A0ABP1D7Y8_9APHY
MRVSTKDLPEAYRPSATKEQAQQAKPFEDLPIILRPHAHLPFPPRMHWGYAIPIESLLDIAVEKMGYKIPDIPESELLPGCPPYNDLFVSNLAMIFLENHVEHDMQLDYQIVFCEGEITYVISICSSWEHCPKALDTAKRLADYFGMTESPKWYLDYHLWHWRYDV